MTKRLKPRGEAGDPHRFSSTARAATTLFGGVTGGVAAVYLITFSLAITALAAVMGTVIIWLVMRGGR